MIAGNFSTHATSNLMLEVAELRPFSSYTFTITASTSIGEGPPTAGTTAVTLEDGMITFSCLNCLYTYSFLLVIVVFFVCVLLEVAK